MANDGVVTEEDAFPVIPEASMSASKVGVRLSDRKLDFGPLGRLMLCLCSSNYKYGDKNARLAMARNKTLTHKIEQRI